MHNREGATRTAPRKINSWVPQPLHPLKKFLKNFSPKNSPCQNVVHPTTFPPMQTFLVSFTVVLGAGLFTLIVLHVFSSGKH